MKIFTLALTLILSSCVQAKALPTAKKVDVSQFVGKWYAHYSLPQFFTRNCKAQTAEYEVIDQKTISVLNTCLKTKQNKTIEGEAVVINPGDNSKLVVTFNNFFTRLFRVKGDYNILKIDASYEHVLVGSNNLKSLWLMSRSELPWPKEIEDEYLNYAKSLGFNTDKLIKSQF